MNRNALQIAALAAVGLCLISATAWAQQGNSTVDQRFGFNGIGARIGYVDPDGASGTVAYGVHVDLGQPVRNVNIVPILEYWKAGVSSFDVSDLTLGSNVNVDFPLQGGTMVPYVGGGLGWHILKADLPPGTLGDDSRTKFGAHVHGGVQNKFMPNLGLFGEVRFSLVEDTDKFKLMGGFTYYFIY